MHPPGAKGITFAMFVQAARQIPRQDTQQPSTSLEAEDDLAAAVDILELKDAELSTGAPGASEQS